EHIARETGDTVFLQLRSGDESVCIARVEGAYPVRTLALEVGARRPLVVTSGGVAFLAHLPPVEADDIIARCTPAFREWRRPGEAVGPAVGRARKTGHGAVEGRMADQPIFSIGVLLIGSGDITAMISVTALASRMTTARRRTIVQILRDAA